MYQSTLSYRYVSVSTRKNNKQSPFLHIVLQAVPIHSYLLLNIENNNQQGYNHVYFVLEYWKTGWEILLTKHDLIVVGNYTILFLK